MDQFDEFGELAAIVHDVALWFEHAGVACPMCGVFPTHLEGSPCAIGRAVEHRRREVSTV